MSLETLTVVGYVLQNKVTEKFKRPLKKRHSSVYHQPTNRVNKFLAQAIDARSVHREKATHVHLLTLCFKDSAKEAQVTSFIQIPYTRLVYFGLGTRST